MPQKQLQQSGSGVFKIYFCLVSSSLVSALAFPLQGMNNINRINGDIKTA